MCYIFVGVYGLTWAPGAWIYAAEVFPLKYRAKGVGLAAAGNWMYELIAHAEKNRTDSASFNLALAFFVPPAFTNIQWKSYMIFGTFCIAMTFHIFFTYPETVKKSLEEIDQIFINEIPAWRTAQQGTFDEKVAEVEASGGLKERTSTSHNEGVAA